jgi:hypothetical protein
MDPLKKAETFIDKVLTPRRVARSRDSAALRARATGVRKDADLALKELKAGGIDSRLLDKFAADRSKARAKLAADSRRKSIAASTAAADRLRNIPPIVFPFEPMDTVIDQVTFIRTFADQGTILESNIAPEDNWARYEVKSNSDAWDGTGRLSFFILWKNPKDSATVMTPKPNLIINAHLSCDADWAGVASWFGMEETAGGTVSLRTTVWGMDSSVKSVVFQQDDLSAVGVNGGFFGDDSGKSIEFNETLGCSGVVVPPQTYVLIEVEVLSTWHATGNASVHFDAQSGSHRIDLPQIILSTDDLAPPAPPIALSVGVDRSTTPATVVFIWSGANGALVDFYQNGVSIGNATNDGALTRQFAPGTYTFRVCEKASAVCSADVTVTV